MSLVLQRVNLSERRDLIAIILEKSKRKTNGFAGCEINILNNSKNIPSKLKIGIQAIISIDVETGKLYDDIS